MLAVRATMSYVDWGKRFATLIPLLSIFIVPRPCWAQARYYKDDRGVTWKEETSKVQQPVREIEFESRQEQVYREQYVTTTQSYQYLSYSPVTQYQWVPRLHDWWRIFRGPYVAYHLEPQLAWQPRPYTVTVPQVQRQWVPETRTVQAPVSKLRMVEREQTTRTAVSDEGSSLASAFTPITAGPAPIPSVAFDPYSPTGGSLAYFPPGNGTVYLPAQNYPPIYGGIARLDDGLPRTGMAETWHPIR